ncbi:MAG: hypothetical protein H2069_03480 [Legionella sp.]|nr:hypothetical protein [Legionella sp.]
MKTFDLSVFRSTQFYKDFHKLGGTIFVELQQIDTFLEEINALIKEIQDSWSAIAHPKIVNLIKTKIQYANELITFFEKKMLDADSDFLPSFLHGVDFDSSYQNLSHKFSWARRCLRAYFYQAKNFFIHVERVLAERITVEDINTLKNQHLLAIAQHLLPSSKSVVSLMLPELLTQIEKNSGLQDKLTREEIDLIVEKSAKSLADYLYKAEEGAAFNMLNGMRGHYVKQLSQYDNLYQEHIETTLLLQKTEQEKQRLINTIEKNSIEANKHVEELQRLIKLKDDLLAQKDKELIKAGKEHQNLLSQIENNLLKSKDSIKELENVLKRKETEIEHKNHEIRQRDILLNRAEELILDQNRPLAHPSEGTLMTEPLLQGLDQQSRNSLATQKETNITSNMTFFSGIERHKNSNDDVNSKKAFSWSCCFPSQPQ